MQITDSQLAALESAHGAGMVVVLSVGEDEFAFRRPSTIDVDFMLDAKDRGDTRFMEDALVSCALCPEEPTAQTGKSPALAEVKKRLAALFAESPYLKDVIPMAWGSECGWHAVISTESLGNGCYRFACGPKTSESDPSSSAFGCSLWSATVDAQRLTVEQYDRMRKLDLQGGNASERFAWKESIRNGGEVERLYPFLVVSIGAHIRTLGETRAVSVKKRQAGSAPAQSGSISEPARQET